MQMIKWLEVSGSGPLNGRIKVPGSKNSSLALITAACMADAPVTLGNIPNISDIRALSEILKSIGVDITTAGNSLYIDPRGLGSSMIDPLKSSAFRTGYYFIGALLAKFKKVTVGYPGGDNLGARPIDQHIKGLKALGAEFLFFEDHYVVQAEKLTGAEIYFDVITSGATINLLFASVFASGRTVLYNAARDPEVVDTAIMLNKMGARIHGAGTDTIRIDGVAQLGGCSHTAIPDRLVAGAFFMAAGITNGTILLEDIIPEHLESCIKKLSEIGLQFDVKDNSITVSGSDVFKAARVKTGMYPILATDFQQPLTALLLRASGKSAVTDRVFPGRFAHCEQLKRMGADITVKNGTASILGGRPLYGTWVHAGDIRAGTCLILAGMVAEGKTVITGVEHVERGYEDIVSLLKYLGANVRLCKSDDGKFNFQEELLVGNIPTLL